MAHVSVMSRDCDVIKPDYVTSYGTAPVSHFYSHFKCTYLGFFFLKKTNYEYFVENVIVNETQTFEKYFPELNFRQMYIKYTK